MVTDDRWRKLYGVLGERKTRPTCLSRWTGNLDSDTGCLLEEGEQGSVGHGQDVDIWPVLNSRLREGDCQYQFDNIVDELHTDGTVEVGKRREETRTLGTIARRDGEALISGRRTVTLEEEGMRGGGRGKVPVSKVPDY